MYCVITHRGKIIGVLMMRNIDKEGRWKANELNKLSGDTGAVLYSAEDLKGYETFTKSYGYQLVYNKNGEAIKVLDREGNDIPNNDLRILDVDNYPELLEVLYNK